MEKFTSTRLTVYFEDPFWVGIFEAQKGRKYETARFVFGAEPTDLEVLHFILNHYYDLKFTPSETTAVIHNDDWNFKRRQREARKEMIQTGIGTKAQQNLKLAHEFSALERKKKTKDMKEAEKELQFNLKQEKKKEKHRGH